MVSVFEKNLLQVKNQIANAARKVHRSTSEVTIVVVTKKIDVGFVDKVICFNVKEFGENRVSELLRKKTALENQSANWHLIGHLQSNKLRKIVGQCCLIHSVDSLELLQGIQRVAAERDIKQRVLLQVNVSKEVSKHGFDVSEVENVVAKALLYPNIQLDGLMTMAPLADSAEDSRKHFKELRNLRDMLVAKGYISIRHLSMGMSNDFEVAVEEGATLVRVGSRLFEGTGYTVN